MRCVFFRTISSRPYHVSPLTCWRMLHAPAVSSLCARARRMLGTLTLAWSLCLSTLSSVTRPLSHPLNAWEAHVKSARATTAPPLQAWNSQAWQAHACDCWLVSLRTFLARAMRTCIPAASYLCTHACLAFCSQPTVHMICLLTCALALDAIRKNSLKDLFSMCLTGAEAKNRARARPPSN